jgi:DNA-directed RNA polymerase subunit RPC12/RpoP
LSDHVHCHWIDGECFDYVGKCFNCLTQKKCEGIFQTQKGDKKVTDIVCPHCGKKIRLNIETDPRATLLRVDVTKPKEAKNDV